jgi:hypothetical protein
MIESSNENNLWKIDLLGRILHDGRSKYIIVAINHFSKWIETQVIDEKTFAAIIQFLQKKILKRNTKPARILSDIGKEFKNGAITNFAESNNIQWIYAARAHHHTMGCVEKVNRTLLVKVKKLSEYGNIEWPSVVKQATRAVNISFHRAFKTPPFIFRYGKLPSLPIDEKLQVNAKVFSRKRLLKECLKHKAKYES